MLLGVDLGTSSVKAALYDVGGKLLAERSAVYPTRRDGSLEEQEPSDWVAAVGELVSALTEHQRPNAMAFTGQMSGMLLLDESGAPLLPFLPWSDRRAEGEAQELASRFGGAEVYRNTGCRTVGSYPAAKLCWVKANRPEVWGRVRRISGAREYLSYLLTGEFVTDPSCAGATQLFDLDRQAWWAPMLRHVGVRPSVLPAVRAPWERLGMTIGRVPVAVGAGDGPCSSLGAGATEPGDVVVSVGTSGVVRVLDRSPLLHPEGATTCYPLGPDLYFGTGVTGTAGAALDWAARLLGLGSAQDLEDLAEEAEPGAGGVIFVPDLTGGRTPTWAPGARGSFSGLDLSHGRAELARAAIEGVALSLWLALEALKTAGAKPRRLLLTGGGSRSRLLGATLAGLTGLPTMAVRGGDATLGAAQLAAVAGGLFPDLAAARAAMAPALEPVPPVAVPPGLAERYRRLAAPEE